MFVYDLAARLCDPHSTMELETRGGGELVSAEEVQQIGRIVSGSTIVLVPDIPQ
jgi:hypothetical protein